MSLREAAFVFVADAKATVSRPPWSPELHPIQPQRDRATPLAESGESAFASPATPRACASATIPGGRAAGCIAQRRRLLPRGSAGREARPGR
jgi:hypothetical protein